VSGRPSTTAAPRLAPPDPPRIRRLRASHSYGLVLALVLASFLFTLVAPEAAWTNSVLVIVMAVTAACALWTSGMRRAHSRRNASIAALALTAAVVNVVPGGAPAAGATAIFACVLTVTVAVVIGIGVVDQGEANRNSIRGAIAIYVLLGLMFMFAYGAVAALGDGAFFAQGTDGTRAVRAYFSYTTLATLGYGDYTAAGSLGHALSVVEALLGQLYLVTVVALLVSRLQGRKRSADADADGHSPLIPPG
jgi:hypothetical protein